MTRLERDSKKHQQAPRERQAHARDGAFISNFAHEPELLHGVMRGDRRVKRLRILAGHGLVHTHPCSQGRFSRPHKQMFLPIPVRSKAGCTHLPTCARAPCAIAGAPTRVPSSKIPPVLSFWVTPPHARVPASMSTSGQAPGGGFELWIGGPMACPCGASQRRPGLRSGPDKRRPGLRSCRRVLTAPAGDSLWAP